MFKQTLIAISISAFSTFSFANTCDLLPNHQQLTSALKSSVATTSDEKNGGLETVWSLPVFCSLQAQHNPDSSGLRRETLRASQSPAMAICKGRSTQVSE